MSAHGFMMGEPKPWRNLVAGSTGPRWQMFGATHVVQMASKLVAPWSDARSTDIQTHTTLRNVSFSMKKNDRLLHGQLTPEFLMDQGANKQMVEMSKRKPPSASSCEYCSSPGGCFSQILHWRFLLITYKRSNFPDNRILQGALRHMQKQFPYVSEVSTVLTTTSRISLRSSFHGSHNRVARFSLQQ